MRAMTAKDGGRGSQRETARAYNSGEDPAPGSRPLPYTGTSLSESLGVDVEPVRTAAPQAPSTAQPVRQPVPSATSEVAPPVAKEDPRQERVPGSVSKLDELKAVLAAQKAERETSAAQQTVSAQATRRLLSDRVARLESPDVPLHLQESLEALKSRMANRTAPDLDTAASSEQPGEAEGKPDADSSRVVSAFTAHDSVTARRGGIPPQVGSSSPPGFTPSMNPSAMLRGNVMVRGDSYNCLTLAEDDGEQPSPRPPSPGVRPMFEMRGDSYGCLTELNDGEESSDLEKRTSVNSFDSGDLPWRRSFDLEEDSSPLVNPSGLGNLGMRGDSYKCLTDLEATTWSPPASPEPQGWRSGTPGDEGVFIGAPESAHSSPGTEVRLMESSDMEQEPCKAGGDHPALFANIANGSRKQSPAPAVTTDRRRALSGRDSPRAEGLPEPASWEERQLKQPVTQEPAAANGPRSGSPGDTSSQSPKLSPQMERVLQGGGALRNSPTVLLNVDCIPDPPWGPLPPLSSMQDPSMQDPSLPEESQTPTIVPARRRQALSGCDSPRAPATRPSLDSLDLELVLEDWRAIDDSDSSLLPPLQSMMDFPPRRQALSGCDSPRAPPADSRLGELEEADTSNPPWSPLPPLSTMQDWSPREDSRQPNEARPTERRRTALSGCDSPRAPPAAGSSLGDLDLGEERSPDSPLPPLETMLDDCPPSTSPQDREEEGRPQKLSPQMARLLPNGGTTRPNLTIVRGTRPNLTIVRGTSYECLPGQTGEESPEALAEEPRPVPTRRRTALSGCDSPRAPVSMAMRPGDRIGTVVDQDLLDQGPDQDRLEGLLDGGMSPLPPLSSMMDLSPNSIQPAERRRTALSGCDSPRAPGKAKVNGSSLNDLEQLESLADEMRDSSPTGGGTFRDGSSMPPLSTMQDLSPASLKPAERRRTALSGCDSPRAPPLDGSALLDNIEARPNSPLPPLAQMQFGNSPEIAALDGGRETEPLELPTSVAEERPKSRPQIVIDTSMSPNQWPISEVTAAPEEVRPATKTVRSPVKAETPKRRTIEDILEEARVAAAQQRSKTNKGPASRSAPEAKPSVEANPRGQTGHQKEGSAFKREDNKSPPRQATSPLRQLSPLLQRYADEFQHASEERLAASTPPPPKPLSEAALSLDVASGLIGSGLASPSTPDPGPRRADMHAVLHAAHMETVFSGGETDRDRMGVSRTATASSPPRTTRGMGNSPILNRLRGEASPQLVPGTDVRASFNERMARMREQLSGRDISPEQERPSLG